MNPDTERIELPDGQWWEIKAWLSRKDRKQLNRLEKNWWEVREDLTPTEMADNPEAAIRINMDNMDTDARDDLLLQLGTVAWSFSDKFSLVKCDALNDDYVAPVLIRMKDLYMSLAEQKLINAKKG